MLERQCLLTLLAIRAAQKQNKTKTEKQNNTHTHTQYTKQGNQKHSLSPPISKHDIISHVKSHKELGHGLHQLLIFQKRK